MLVCFYDAVNLFSAPRQSSLIGDKQPFLFQPILGLGGRGQPLDHMRSSLGSAGFTNQEDALNARWGTLSLLAQLRCLLCKAFFKGCSLFGKATPWHALLHPFEVCGSATGGFITDESHVPSGDDEVCAAILRNAKVKKLTYVLFFGTIRPASIVCVTASASRFSAGSSRLTSLGPLQSSTE